MTIPIVIDTQAPTVTLETPVEIDRINDAAYFLSGTCSEDREEVGIVFTDSEATPNVISKTAYCVGTAWQRQIDVTALRAGSVNIGLSHIDGVGNPATFTTVSVNRDDSVEITLDTFSDIHANNELIYQLSGTCSQENVAVEVTLTDSADASVQPSIQPTCLDYRWSVSGFNVSGLADGQNDNGITISVVHDGQNAAAVTVSKGCFAGGTGNTASDPKIICNYGELKGIALDKHYALGNNIDATASWSEGAADCLAYDGVTLPVGNSMATPPTVACTGMAPLGTLTGSFDGRNFEIRHVYINDSNGKVGLFREIDSVSFKNVHLRSVRVHNRWNGVNRSETGGLSGFLNKSVNHCSVTGKVTGPHYVGGMGGTLRSSIINSYVDVVVQGGDDSGGFVGRIISSYNFIAHSHGREVFSKPGV